MSNQLKTQLLMATAMFAVSGTAANAQVQYPAAELHGVGASSIQEILVRELNCVGPAALGAAGNVLGKNDTTTAVVAQGKSTDATFTCGTNFIQPLIGGKYVSTGSGDGRKAFRTVDVSAILPAAKWPTAFGATATAWGNAHFSFTDSGLGSTDLSDYNTTAGTKKSGAAIQVPLYLLPVAIAYNPIYGKKFSDNTYSGTALADLTFNVANPVIGFDGKTLAGGLRMTKQIYCSIFNGYITNWNDAKLAALNIAPKAKVATSLMAAADSSTRWASEGVPIRLVGRSDGSGTTDIFTRHLAAVCGGGIMGTSNPNKYLKNADALPYDGTVTISLASTRYKPANLSDATISFAGTSNMIGGATYTSGVLSGTEVAGKFAVANGSGDINSALTAAPDVASTFSDTTVGYKLNGKIAYISSDFVAPAPLRLLHAAALEVGSSAQTKKPVFQMPTSTNAALAFGTAILPPEADKGGKYVKGGAFSRSNPLDWYEALYSGSGASTLANPVTGYPITGTTQFVTGTCFNNAGVRNALVAFLTAKVGKLTADSAGGNKKLLSTLFSSNDVKTLSLAGQVGIAPMPKAWNVAIYETFLTRSKMKSGTDLLVTRNLYIQNGLPTLKVTGLKTKTVLVAADLATTVSTSVKGKTVYFEAAPNSNCVGLTGTEGL